MNVISPSKTESLLPNPKKRGKNIYTVLLQNKKEDPKGTQFQSYFTQSQHQLLTSTHSNSEKENHNQSITTPLFSRFLAAASECTPAKEASPLSLRECEDSPENEIRSFLPDPSKVTKTYISGLSAKKLTAKTPSSHRNSKQSQKKPFTERSTCVKQSRSTAILQKKIKTAGHSLGWNSKTETKAMIDIVKTKRQTSSDDPFLIEDESGEEKSSEDFESSCSEDYS